MTSQTVPHTHIMDYHPKPKSLKQRVDDIYSKFSRKLYQIELDYVNTKMNPNISMFQTLYDKKLRGVHGIQSDLFEESKHIDNEQTNLGKRHEQYVQVIQEEKEIEKMYQEKIDAMRNSSTGSAGLRKNLTDSYKLQYASNFFMILGIIMASIILYIVFAKKIITGEVSIQPGNMITSSV